MTQDRRRNMSDTFLYYFCDPDATIMIDNSRFKEEDFTEFLNTLIEGHMLEPMAEGIARIVLDKGVEALSDKQRFVFEKEALGYFYVDKCALDGADIPWSEMLEAADNGGYCSRCAQMAGRE
jgi:hypothetical protein